MSEIDANVLGDVGMQAAMKSVLQLLTALQAEDTELVLGLLGEAVELSTVALFNLLMALTEMSVALMGLLEDLSGTSGVDAVRELGLLMLQGAFVNGVSEATAS